MLIGLPTYAVFSDRIHYEEIDRIPTHWLGTYTIHPEDHWWDDDPDDKPPSLKLRVKPESLSYFGKSITPTRITVPRFGRSSDKIYIEYSNFERVELHLLKLREVMVQESKQTYGESWSIFEYYKFVAD